jgi:alkylation response protein AidB-like acyl-CoA dehydrogenase
MDFNLTEEQQMMRNLARDFARKEIRPLANKYYREDKKVPKEELDALICKANQLRLLDYYYPEEYGGLGITDRLLTCIITEELSWADSGIYVHLSASSLAAKALSTMGSLEQRKQWLPKFTNPNNEARIPGIAAFCLTEPEAGSHVLGMTTTAKQVGNEWVINGRKTFITNGGRADVYIVVAQTNTNAETTAERAMGLAGFLVEKGTKGLSFSSDFKKWGVLASNTTEVIFDNVRIPLTQRLGGADGSGGEGMGSVYETLEATRVGVAAAALGIGRAAYESAVTYAKGRVQRKPIIEYQGVSHKLAEMETELNAARLLTWHAAWKVNNKLPLDHGEGSQAKFYASEVAVQTCLKAIQIHGGYGFMKEYDVGRWLNDAIIFRIWEGTSEVQKNTIAKYVANLDFES